MVDLKRIIKEEAKNYFRDMKWCDIDKFKTSRFWCLLEKHLDLLFQNLVVRQNIEVVGRMIGMIMANLGQTASYYSHSFLFKSVGSDNAILMAVNTISNQFSILALQIW